MSAQPQQLLERLLRGEHLDEATANALLRIMAGGGIVADSAPDMEYQEVLAKSAILRRALELAQEGL